MEIDADPATTKMPGLLDQSNEVLHLILSYANPADLGALGRTCRSLSTFIENNDLLWKELYLQNWDHPPTIESKKQWQQQTQALVSLEKLMACSNMEQKRGDLEWVCKTILPLLDARKQERNRPFLEKLMEQPDNKDCFLAGSNLFKSAGTVSQQPASTPELRQMSAKLHCLYGVPIDSYPDPMRSITALHRGIPMTLALPRSKDDHDHLTRSQTVKIPTNHVARAKVYDLREYTDGTLWGPFHDDGLQRVDWEKVEAVMVVLGYNLYLYSQRTDHLGPVWRTPWDGASPHSYRAPVKPAKDDEAADLRRIDSPQDDAPGPSREALLAAQDPYGVTGTWMRVVCFLDYNDLYAFNFGQRLEPGQARAPIDTKEAIRLITLKLHVVKIVPPAEDDHPDHPVVWFRGNSRSLHASWDPNANSKIRGCVRTTPEGEIRWTTWSIFHGEERWRSEGVQVGGIRSKRGVLGNWFDKDFDDHGPAGPTAFWKLDDDHTENPALAPERLPMPYVWEWNDDDEDSDEEDEEDEDDASAATA